MSYLQGILYVRLLFLPTHLLVKYLNIGSSANTRPRETPNRVAHFPVSAARKNTEYYMLLSSTSTGFCFFGLASSPVSVLS